MANRVTVTELKQIIDIASEVAAADVTIHINVANRLVTDICVDSSLSTARLKDIELFLSAHFIATGRDPRAASEKAGPVSQRLQHKLDLGLNNTHYGQQAMLLDTSGALASLDKNKRPASLTAINIV